ncbi:hypothetical protein HCN44_006720 [Aphidius gifuensis]|uniref:Uncharacterized protein n=1 Tax=Aphidius gifuensis TaxID=684658 RepID=A0A835CVQ7_APHGI|nr:hypothetical protein HCN44_006720 [Aphidius gifuensis]
MNQIKQITINASKCIPAMWGRPSMVNRCSSVIAPSKLHQLSNYQCQMRQLHTGDKKDWKVNVPSHMIEMTEDQKIVLKIYDLEETTSNKTHELHLSFDDDGKLYVQAKEDSNV